MSPACVTVHAQRSQRFDVSRLGTEDYRVAAQPREDAHSRRREVSRSGEGEGGREEKDGVGAASDRSRGAEGGRQEGGFAPLDEETRHQADDGFRSRSAGFGDKIFMPLCKGVEFADDPRLLHLHIHLTASGYAGVKTIFLHTRRSCGTDTAKSLTASGSCAGTNGLSISKMNRFFNPKFKKIGLDPQPVVTGGILPVRRAET